MAGVIEWLLDVRGVQRDIRGKIGRALASIVVLLFLVAFLLDFQSAQRSWILANACFLLTTSMCFCT